MLPVTMTQSSFDDSAVCFIFLERWCSILRFHVDGSKTCIKSPGWFFLVDVTAWVSFNSLTLLVRQKYSKKWHLYSVVEKPAPVVPKLR